MSDHANNASLSGNSVVPGLPKICSTPTSASMSRNALIPVMVLHARQINGLVTSNEFTTTEFGSQRARKKPRRLLPGLAELFFVQN